MTMTTIQKFASIVAEKYYGNDCCVDVMMDTLDDANIAYPTSGSVCDDHDTIARLYGNFVKQDAMRLLERAFSTLT